MTVVWKWNYLGLFVPNSKLLFLLLFYLLLLFFFSFFKNSTERFCNNLRCFEKSVTSVLSKCLLFHSGLTLLCSVLAIFDGNKLPYFLFPLYCFVRLGGSCLEKFWIGPNKGMCWAEGMSLKNVDVTYRLVILCGLQLPGLLLTNGKLLNICSGNEG